MLANVIFSTGTTERQIQSKPVKKEWPLEDMTIPCRTMARNYRVAVGLRLFPTSVGVDSLAAIPPSAADSVVVQDSNEYDQCVT